MEKRRNTSKGGKSPRKFPEWLNNKNRGDKGESSADLKSGVKEWQNEMAESEEDVDNLLDNLKDLSTNKNEEELLFSEDITSN